MDGIVKKISDEGPSVPFIARAYVGVFEIRDQVFRSEKDRLKFDRAYWPILQNLTECRKAHTSLAALCAKYEKQMRSGEIARYDGATLHVDRTIDAELNALVKEFFIKGHIVLEGLQCLKYLLGFSLSALMGKDNDFQKEKTTLLQRPDDAEFVGRLIAFMAQARAEWLAEFKKIRINVEHHGWSLPAVTYGLLADGTIAPVFPELANQHLSDALRFFWDRLFDLCEQIVVVGALGQHLQPPRYLVEIPEEQRDPDRPTRFRVWADFN